MTRLLVALAAVIAGSGLAWAASPPAPPAPDAFARICDAFGEGYHLIPGTLTCVKVSGSVMVGISAGSGNRPPDGSPPPGDKH